MSTSDGRSLPSEACGWCNGSGEIVREVAGRTGYVECPECENVPESAIPNEVPDDPEGRVEEIDVRLNEFAEKKERADALRSEINNAQSTLEEIADADLLPEEVGTRFGFIAEQIRLVRREIDVQRGISYQREALKREQAEIQTLLDALQSAADGEESA
jgi:uncharacterized Zn finger protein (UPF0148 family)